MCGIFYCKCNNNKINIIKKNIENIIEKIKYRGPDKTNMEENNNILFVHTLLAIQGFKTQPISSENKMVIFNGEIYGTSKIDSNNLPEYEKIPEIYENDTEFLLEYLKNNMNKLDELDGEYIINFFDFDKNELHIITDPFFTKPFYIYNSNELFIGSSYKSCINKTLGILEIDNSNILSLRPNIHYCFNLENNELLYDKEIIKWDFNPKNDIINFNRWNKAYELSLEKRTNTDKNFFVPLSSGYDSGCIVSGLIKLNKKFKTYTFKGKEDINILNKRKNIIELSKNSFYYINPKENIDNKYREYCKRIEQYYAYHQNGNIYADIYNAYSCFGIYQIFQEAIKDKQIIFLSGHGGDEIFSDYGNIENRSASCLNMDYTNIRNKWPNFDSSYGRNIIQMFERVAGCFGIESRYPFLDKHVVQEFLWLNDNIKNKEFKQCIAQYMRKEQFPFLDNKKCSVRVLTDKDGGNESFFKIAEDIQKEYNLYKKYKNIPTKNRDYWEKNGIKYYPNSL